jgi:hypothetical protein
MEMNNRLIIVFLIIIISSFLCSQNVQETPWSNCNFSPNARKKIEDWLNKSMNEAKKAVKDGRIYNNGHHKYTPCKIKEIEILYKNLIFEYDCTCGECGWGGPSHKSAKDRPFIRICQPLDMYLNQEKNLNQTSIKLCGCIQGLIVHELTHAAGDDTEEGAVDCSKILYPCATDPYGDEIPDHSNCTCCEEEGK